MNNGLGIEDGNGSHSTRKFPTLLAGGGKLGIKLGQHLVYEKDRTLLCNLHVTLIQGMGLERVFAISSKQGSLTAYAIDNKGGMQKEASVKIGQRFWNILVLGDTSE